MKEKDRDSVSKIERKSEITSKRKSERKRVIVRERQRGGYYVLCM